MSQQPDPATNTGSWCSCNSPGPALSSHTHFAIPTLLVLTHPRALDASGSDVTNTPSPPPTPSSPTPTCAGGAGRLRVRDTGRQDGLRGQHADERAAHHRAVRGRTREGAAHIPCSMPTARQGQQAHALAVNTCQRLLFACLAGCLPYTCSKLKHRTVLALLVLGSCIALPCISWLHHFC